jgi:hypothetical protein
MQRVGDPMINIHLPPGSVLTHGRDSYRVSDDGNALVLVSAHPISGQLAVGEVFIHGSHTLKVTQAEGCANCFFDKLKCVPELIIGRRPACDRVRRVDKTRVAFVEVKHD